MRLAPVTVAEANAYVAHVHRHNGALPQARLAVALIDDDGTVHGVAVAGIPKARMLMDRGTLEVNRVCTDGTRNACSMLYGAITRAARALGYTRLVTYTLASEPGSSLRASGWTATAQWQGGEWATPGNPARNNGTNTHDTGPKVRWEIQLGAKLPALTWPAIDNPDQPSLWGTEHPAGAA
jgi:hypothetical protein